MVRKSGILAFMIFVQALALPIAGAGGLKNDLAFIREHKRTGPEPAAESFSSFFAEETREIRLAVLGGMRLYQIFISSQDMSACIFSPSCSRFGMRAISKYGLIHGALMASDRLLRCNGIARRYYPLDPTTGLSLDYPVEQYHLHYRIGPADNCAPHDCAHPQIQNPKGR